MAQRLVEEGGTGQGSSTDHTVADSTTAAVDAEETLATTGGGLRYDYGMTSGRAVDQEGNEVKADESTVLKSYGSESGEEGGEDGEDEEYSDTNPAGQGSKRDAALGEVVVKYVGEDGKRRAGRRLDGVWGRKGARDAKEHVSAVESREGFECEQDEGCLWHRDAGGSTSANVSSAT